MVFFLFSVKFRKVYAFVWQITITVYPEEDRKYLLWQIRMKISNRLRFETLLDPVEGE